MRFCLRLSSAALLPFLLQLATGIGHAQGHQDHSDAVSLTPLCQPSVTVPVTVVSHNQTTLGGERSEPPLTDPADGNFDWPDTVLGALKTADGYEFFGSDGGYHPRQQLQGSTVGSNTYGSVVLTAGTLDNPIGTGHPQNVTISSNPDPAVNPGFSGYTYLGGGPVFRVPAGMTGAGNLIVGYHAELPNDALYAVHGLAASWDNGLHWTDLGEVVRPNQSYAANLPGFDEIGDGPLVLSPDGKYFYFFFPDWPAGASGSNHISISRAPVASVLEAAFGSGPPRIPGLDQGPDFVPGHPHTVAFEKYYEATWNLQPGIGGASSDLIPNTQYLGYLDVHFDSYLKRYVLVTSDDTTFRYAESADGFHWTTPIVLGTYGAIAAYPTSVGLGDDASILGQSFYVYYTFFSSPQSGGNIWERSSVKRLTVSCQ